MRWKEAKATLGARWQIAAIKSTQTYIKLLSKRAAAYGSPFYWLDEEIKKVTDELIEELDSESLKQLVKGSFRELGRNAYLEFLKIFAPPEIIALAQNAKGYEYKAQFVEAENATHTAMAYTTGTAGNMYFGDYIKSVKQHLMNIADMSARPVYGERINLLNIAEAQTRYEENQKQIENMKYEGTKLVYVEPHANCSERCAHWQPGGDKHSSGLYSLDGTTGKSVDGVPFIPIETAIEVYVKSKSTGNVWRNGLFGYNCRHKLKPYTRGGAPVPIPAEVIKKRRAIEAKQREMERTYRKYREVGLMAKDIPGMKDFAAYCRKQASELRKEYESYSNKHDTAIYDDRMKVFDGEHSAELSKKIYDRTLGEWAKAMK